MLYLFEFVNILRQEIFFFFFVKKNVDNFDVSNVMISFENNKNVNLRSY